KCEQVKNMTLACLMGTHTGLLLFGAGGNGKSYSIREMLAERHIKEITPEEIEALAQAADEAADDDDPHGETKRNHFSHDCWVLHQGRMTAKVLVSMMCEFPESIHVVEDAETLFDSKDAWGVLRMALASQDKSRHSRRHITWTTSVAKGSYNF